MASSQFEPSPLVFRLTADQKSFLASLLPLHYSLQLAVATPNPSRVPASRRPINTYPRQEPTLQKQALDSKRKKNKNIQQAETLPESKPCLSQREQLNRRASIVRRLRKHQASWPFRTAVDPKVLQIPNYYQIVLVPMDLHTIEQNLRNEKYEHAGEIERDINQMFLNSYKFNAKNGEYFEATTKLQEYYRTLLAEGDQAISGRRQAPDKPRRKQQSHGANGEGEKTSQVSEFQRDLTALLKKANEIISYKPVRQKPVYVSLKQEGSISIKQKRELISQIRHLEELHLARIYEIVKQSKKDALPEGEVISLDVDKMDNRLIRELQNYVRLQRNSLVHDHEESVADSQDNQYSIC